MDRVIIAETIRKLNFFELTNGIIFGLKWIGCHKKTDLKYTSGKLLLWTCSNQRNIL